MLNGYLSLILMFSERFDLEGLKASDGFANLDRALQDIIDSITTSQVSQIAFAQQCSERTVRHISESFARSRNSHTEERFYRDIKDSLFYPDIFSRAEQIVHEFDGMEDSYQWIFEGPPNALDEPWQDFEMSRKNLDWDSFSDWLETGNTIYWINGKAGSGKSTLMHHIYEHECTVKHLKQWGAGKILLTAAFFFWNAGSRQQKTTDGLLRSLIYQMLTKCPQLVACFDKVSKKLRKGSGLGFLLTHHTERANTRLDRDAVIEYLCWILNADLRRYRCLSLHRWTRRA